MADSMSPGSSHFFELLRVVAPRRRRSNRPAGSTRHAHGVVLGLAHAPAHGVDLPRDAQFVLHVVADLVRDDVGLRKLARSTHAAQRVVETQVDVDLLVAGAVERPHGRLPGTAGRGRGAAEQHQLGRVVGAAVALENVGPHHLGVAQDGRDKSRLLVGGRWRMRRALLLNLWRRLAAAQQAQHRQRVDAGDPAGDQRHSHRAQPHAASADGKAAAPAASAVAAVFDVVGLFVAFPLHGVPPWRLQSRL